MKLATQKKNLCLTGVEFIENKFKNYFGLYCGYYSFNLNPIDCKIFNN